MPIAVMVAAVLATWGPPPDVPELELQWDAPASCPDEGEVRRRVASYVGDEPDRRPLRARGRVARLADGRWQLRLELEHGDKSIDAESCDALADAAAVVLSLAITPGGATRDPATDGDEPDGDGESETAAPPRAVADEDGSIETAVPPRAVADEDGSIEATAPPRSRWSGLVRADAGIGVGVTPTLTTARLALGVVGPWVRVELDGTLWAPADPQLRSGVFERVTLGTVGARGCGQPILGPVAIPLCAGIALGALRFDEGGATPRTVHRLWSGVTASAAVVWPATGVVSLWVGPELSVALQRIAIPLGSGDPDYRSGRIAVRGAAGIELHFGSRIGTRAGKGRR